MSEKSLYPTKREKALHGNKAARVEDHHQITSSAIVLFRKSFSLAILLYMLMLVLSGFEIFASLMQVGPIVQARTVPIGLVFLMSVLMAISMMMHNQIIMILGHGYKDKTAQLFVDKLSSKEDCYISLNLIKTMYVMMIFMPVVMLAPFWWFAGDVGILSQITLQIEGLSALNEGMKATEATGGVVDSYKHIKWYLLAVTGGLLMLILMGIVGWIYTAVAKIKI